MLKKSVLLEYLINYADKLRLADGKKSLSANYFFASVLQAVIDKSNAKLPDELNNPDSVKELDELASLLQTRKIDCESSVKSVLEEIKAEGYNSSMDELVFSKFNYTAETKAKQLKKSVIDASVYLTMILEEPTKAIEKLILPQEKKTLAEEVDKVISEIDRLIIDLQKQDQDAEQETEKNSEPEEAPEESTGTKRLSKLVDNTRAIQKFLLERVYGQDQAVSTFVSGYFQSQIMSQSGKNANKPQATFLFAGPPGVGKTFLAEKAAEALKLPFRRFDMSEYSDNESSVEFIGSDNVYKNGKPGNVTSFVADNPECVILFDEIEKAHLTVIHLFLQLLDAGRLRDNYTDEEVSFSKTVIILTTNAGKNLYNDPTVSNLSSIPRKTVLRALSTDVNPETKTPLFPAAICSRFASGNVVMFNRLGASNLFTIANRELRGDSEGLKESTGLEVVLDKKVPTAIILAEGGNADARTVKGCANAFFHEELYELFRLLSANDADIAEKLKRVEVNVSLEGTSAEVSRMFVSPSKPEALIFTNNESFISYAKTLEQVVCYVTSDFAEAKELLFNHDISVILCDLYCNRRDPDKQVLNIEDISSDGRDFLTYTIARYSIPIHLLQMEGEEIGNEEFLSFAMLGVQDALTFKAEDKASFENQIAAKCDIAYQQSNMIKLARENKIVTYKTSQTVSEDKSVAQINLFDFKMTVATDAEDSHNVLDNVSRPDVSFEDVIGAEDAKKELAYFAEYLKNPTKYMRLGVRAPKGVLLYGPPGTGKTMLAKAMAGESNVTFLATEGNQFLKRFIGEGPQAVHDLFASARKYAPSILFVDEIDAIGKNRNSPGTDNVGDVLTAFLTEMDGFKTDTSKPVFVLAATNYDVDRESNRSLDPALVRRFDRRIYVDLPTKDERKRFLHMKAKSGKMLSLSEEQIENIAIRSTGMSLSELDSVYEMALRNAVRSENHIVDDVAFEEAFETFNNGERRQWNKDSLERTARHEAGHALLCWLGGEKPSYLTIVARGDHGGYMQHSDSEGKGTYTRAELLGKIRTSLAGRAAEIVYYGDEDGISTGAGGDLYSATLNAEYMICRYGMDDTIGLSYIDSSDRSSPYYSDVRKRVNEILAEELKNAIKIITENRAAMDKMVEALLLKNHLKENEINEIFKESIITNI